jgi:superfamily II RNA helicase
MRILTNQINYDDISSTVKSKIDKYSFLLDSFQLHGISAIENNENVLVTAHTGSGKTIIAEYAIRKAIEMGKKVIYTSPIKSLSNQKYYEFKTQFPDISVGILTGDIKFNPLADCLIMTTEILRNLLFNRKINQPNSNVVVDLDIEADVHTVIFDEVHYINDKSRGKVWEESIILLPQHINMVMLSATINKPEIFAKWIDKIKEKDIALIPTDTRVVPLTHLFYQKLGLKESRNLDHDDDVFKYDDKLIEIKGSGGYNGNELSRLLNATQKRHRVFNYKSIINESILHLRNHSMLPALYFVFSRKKCEEYAKRVPTNLLTSEEQAELSRKIDFYIHKLDNAKQYKTMTQYFEIRDLLMKGIAYHHSGVLPVFKELIELLFNDKLIKVLFCTESMAIGVNLPAKSVVFTGVSKYDSVTGFRGLYPHEYIQMSGRAGRRGIDTHGYVIHLTSLYQRTELVELNTMFSGTPQTIRSQFTFNYQLLLKCLLTESVNIDYIADLSMSNDEISKALNTYQRQLDDMPEIDISRYADCVRYDELTQKAKGEDFGNGIMIKLNNKAFKRNTKQRAKLTRKTGFSLLYEEYKKLGDKIAKRQKLVDNVDYYTNMMSNSMKNTLEFLRKHDYVDIDHKPTMKGVIASQINEANPIFLTELLVGGQFDDLSVEGVIDILSLFINGKAEDIDHQVQTEIDAIGRMMEDDENRMRLPCSDWELNTGFYAIAREWYSGRTFEEIKRDYGVFEGNFIRNIIKLDNMAQELISAAQLLQKENLAGQLDSLHTKMVRDIAHIDSIYIKL